eukprot:TRINITY_DN14291_c0_g1_i1.p1 TRINITY_DN14291_c0_g1~~TRINITY_DN14291_c0_g1_i1.p1  ORF type:complete len:801 (+),score=169.82 TRINITY_DN14291_c0_g1_i1:726-3128(+)
MIKGRYQPEFSRTREATLPAFTKHVSQLIADYESVHVVDLLDAKKKEQEISEAFVFQISALGHEKLKHTHWDFHQECAKSRYENISKLFSHLSSSVSEFKWFHRDPTGNVINLQQGVFRLNCLDCLDRTNVIEGSIAKYIIPMQFAQIGIEDPVSEFSGFGRALKIIWADNGDAISKSYTGTGAMKSEFTRTGKRTFLGMVDDAQKAAARAWINTFKDDETQAALDLFLGDREDEIPQEHLTPVERWVNSQVRFREPEYSTFHSAKIYIGTWNVNGKAPPSDIDLDQWISPENPNGKDVDHDAISMYVFGFQEIVPLNSSSIISADETNMKNWATLLETALNERRKNSQVILCGCVQLVGMAVIVFISSKEAHYLTGFQIMKIKTAGMGYTGNKGALLARFQYKATTICCVTGHFTAGQREVKERIKDIENIISKTRFASRQTATISDHDYQFWFGDFNFRIDLSYSEVIARIKSNDLSALLANDQLQKARITGQVFQGFKEGVIDFLPTYKYNVGTDVYDTSEKRRTPAWCDRILWSNKEDCNAVQLSYSRGEELYFSDHRPVKSLFLVDVKEVDLQKKARIEKEMRQASHLVDQDTINNYNTPWQYPACLSESESQSSLPTSPPLEESVAPISSSSSSSISLFSSTTTSDDEESEDFQNLQREVKKAMVHDNAVQSDVHLYLQSLKAVRQYFYRKQEEKEKEETETEKEEDIKLINRVKKTTNLVAVIVNSLLALLSDYQSSCGAQSLVEALTAHKVSLYQQAKEVVADITDKEKYLLLSHTLSAIEFDVEQHVPTLC